MKRQHAWTSTTLLVLCAAVAQLDAASIVVTSTPNEDGSNRKTVVITENTGEVDVDADGLKTWVGAVNTSEFDMEWELWFDPDPGVGGVMHITNSTGSTQFFSAETGVTSTVAAPVNSLMVGSSSITVADNDISATNASMSAPVSDAIYTGKIQGVTQRTLYPDPYSLTSSGNFTNFDNAFFTGEGTSTALPDGGFLSLRHAFRLSAGDSATANSTFVVDQNIIIPEPTSSVFIWLGVVGLGLCRRKLTLR